MTLKFNNASLPEMGEKLLSYNSFAITGHRSPDGDCLGSQLGLAWALRSLGKDADVLLVEDAPVEQALQFLPGLDQAIPAAEYAKTPECFISVDISEPTRLGASLEVMERCPVSFCVDHHAPKARIFDYLYVDYSAASCTMLVWELLKHLRVDVSKDMALCLYTGLMTDTGRFQYQNADARAFRAAAEMIDAGADVGYASTKFFQSRTLASYLIEKDLIDHISLYGQGEFVLSYLTLDDFETSGAVKADAETAIDVVRSLAGVRIACVLKEHEHFIRGSLRAKDDTNVAEIAALWDGGGHKAAAGFTLHMSLDEARALVTDTICQRFGFGVTGE